MVFAHNILENVITTNTLRVFTCVNKYKLRQETGGIMLPWIQRFHLWAANLASFFGPYVYILEQISWISKSMKATLFLLALDYWNYWQFSLNYSWYWRDLKNPIILRQDMKPFNACTIIHHLIITLDLDLIIYIVCIYKNKCIL